MGSTDELLDNLSGGFRQEEQAVIICLQFPVSKFKDQKAIDAIYELGDILRELVMLSHIGRYGGYEFSETPEGEQISFYLYGKTVRSIYQEIKPILQMLPSFPGSYVIKRYS